jgi:hypothetical protein
MRLPIKKRGFAKRTQFARLSRLEAALSESQFAEMQL